MGDPIRVAMIGPMLGIHAGKPVSQGEILATHLRADGYSVTCASSSLSRVGRLLDMSSTVVRDARRTDVVCLQVYSGLSFVAEDIVSWLAARVGMPLVMHLHGGGLPQFSARYPEWTRRVLSRASVLVAPTAYLARAARAVNLQCRVIPNLIDPTAYVFRHRRIVRPRLLWMRTFDPEYRPDLAVHTLARVREWAPDATLVMAGARGSAEESVRQLVSDLGLRSAVRFAGFLDCDGKNREAANADIYLNTNDVDNTPVSVIEACAMGLLVVSTNVGGMPDLLKHDQTGLLVAPGNPEAMGAAIRRLCESPGLAERLSRRGRAMTDRFTWASAAREWRDVFESVTAPATAEERVRVA